MRACMLARMGAIYFRSRKRSLISTVVSRCKNFWRELFYTSISSTLDKVVAEVRLVECWMSKVVSLWIPYGNCTVGASIFEARACVGLVDTLCQTERKAMYHDNGYPGIETWVGESCYSLPIDCVCGRSWRWRDCLRSSPCLSAERTGK